MASRRVEDGCGCIAPFTPVDRNRWVGCSPNPLRPSPNMGRVGIHEFPFEGCSGFTRFTACQFPAAGWSPCPTVCVTTGMTDNFPGGTLIRWRPAPSWCTHISLKLRVKKRPLHNPANHFFDS